MLREDNLVDRYSRREDCWYREVCNADENCEICIRFQEMQYLMQSSNLPKNKQKPLSLNAPDCDLEAFRRLAYIKSNIEDFVKNGQNLYITSKVTGNGKTSWAIKLLLKYFDQIWAGNGFNVRGVFVHVPTFLLNCKNFKSTDTQFEELKKKILIADLVVWDDIGSTNISGYDYSQLLDYIDSRSLNEQANIFTGNCPTKELLTESVGDRLSSRIWGNKTEVVVFQGGDQR